MTWKNVRLGDIAETTSGGTPNRSNESFWNGHIPWLKSGELNDGIVVSAEEFITEDGLKNSSTKLFQKGTLLLAMYGATAGKLGILDFDSTTNQALCGIKPIKESFDNKFLFNFLLFKRNQIIKDSIGGAQPNISQSYIRDMQIPLPPLPTQQRIATILDKADELRKKDKQLLAKYDALLQSVFYDMFGDPIKNDRKWEKEKIEDVSDSRLGKMLDVKKITGKFLYKYLGNSNVSWHGFNLTNLNEMDFSDNDKRTFNLQVGDILMCEGGEVGRCAIWKENNSEVFFQKALHRIRVDRKKSTPEYFVWLMYFLAKNGGLKDFTTSATIAHLTGIKLKSIKIPLPPINLQNRFASIAENVQQQKQQIKKQMEQSEKLFQGLLQKAFNGELIKE